MTDEIGRNRPGNANFKWELKHGPQFPSPNDTDGIALRREIGRLRQELRRQSSAQQASAETADQLQRENLQLRAAKLEFDHAVKRLRRKLERRSIKAIMRRMLRVLNVARAVEA